MNDDWLDVLRALLAGDARFLVVGAHATAVHEVRGHRVPFLGRAELIVNKRARGRRKDLADLEALGELPPSP